MIAYLLQRPVAVLTSFFCVFVLGIVAYLKLPVALMPDIESPQMVVRVSYPSYGAEYIERNVLTPLRNQFSGLYGLEGIESTSANNTGQINLTFAFGTDMKLAFIEANEKIDQSTGSLPDDLPRPQVLRVSDTDIPILRLQIQSDVIGNVQLSELTKYVIKRRIEGIPGVARVTMNGTVDQEIAIYPIRSKMQALGISEKDVLESVQAANFSQTQIKVKEGIYEYNVRIENPLKSINEVKKIKIRGNQDNLIVLENIADILPEIQDPVGLHYYQGKQGIVMNIHRQSSAKMQLLEAEILKNIEGLKKEFPTITFSTTQNQSSLLRMSIGQLTSSLILGGVLSIVILFLFSANYKLPVLMGVVLPVTMVVTAGIFYLAGLTINIITLSGVILGVGMLIDNGIILIDNISDYYEKGMPLIDACRKGSEEIFSALLSSTFTTLSVFLPLIFLGGIAGTFFTQQAISLAAILLASLLVAFLLLPVLFKQLSPKPTGSSSHLYGKLVKGYKRSRNSKWNYMVWGLFLILIGGLVSAWLLPVSNLPELETESAELQVLWPDPVTIEGNCERMKALKALIDEDLKVFDAEIGIHQLDASVQSYTNSLLVYMEFDSEEEKERNIKTIRDFFESHYPEASCEITRAKNPFDQIFSQKQQFLEIKLRHPEGTFLSSADLGSLDTRNFKYGLGFVEQPGLFLDIAQDRLDRINVSAQSLINQVKYHYQDQLVTEIQRTDRTERVKLAHLSSGNINDLDQIVFSEDSLKSWYPVSYFFDWREVTVPQFVTADLAGPYQSIIFSDRDKASEIIGNVTNWAQDKGLLVEFSGSYFERAENFRRLTLSIILATAMLYFILAAQFESLIQPIIILLTLPVALGGSLIALLLAGSSLNISSMIGIIVTLGIIVNDSILKIDTINRLRKDGIETSIAVKEAGVLRLKPILMTSLTTILALVPMLFSGGLGADLQAPLAVAVIGGLFVGTICSVYLIPCLYEKIYTWEFIGLAN